MLRLRTPSPSLFRDSTSMKTTFKDLVTFSASIRCAIFHGALVFEQPPAVRVVEDIGVEPMTPCLQSRCSSQLS
jgi:hypothetical protein